jgi:Lon protease-like protein
LGITALGQQRFRLLSSEQQHDGLNIGEVELLEAEAPMPVPSDYEGLAKILANVLDDLGRLYAIEGREYDNAVWLTYRFIEILPIDLRQKQQSLESSDTMVRLQLVTRLLDTAREPPADRA